MTALASAAPSWAPFVERVGVPLALLMILLWFLCNPTNGLLTKLVNGILAHLDRQAQSLAELTGALRPIQAAAQELVDQHSDPGSPFTTQRTNYALHLIAQMIVDIAAEVGAERSKFEPLFLEIQRALTVPVELDPS